MQDARHHSIEVSNHIIILDTNRAYPLRQQVLRAAGVVCFLVVMAAPVQFNRELVTRAVKVENIRPNRVLAAKTEAERLEIGWGMWRSAVRMMTRILRAEHPDWTEEEIGREVAGRMARGG